MKISDYLRLAWDQLNRRKVVTAMCAMGIAIGSASIIVALAFGESITHYTQQQMSHYMKVDEITVHSGRGDGTNSEDNKAQYSLTEAKLALIRSLPHVQAAASYRQLGYHSFLADTTKRGNVDLIATELDTLKAFGMEFQQGNESDLDNAIILNYGAAYGLVDEESKRQNGAQSGEETNSYGMPAGDFISYPLYQKQITLQLAIPSNDGQAKTLEIPVRVVGVLKMPEGTPEYMIYNSKQGYISPVLGQRIQEEVNRMATSDNESSSSSGEISELKLKAEAVEHIPLLEKQLEQLRLTPYSNLNQMERMEGEFAIIRIIFGGAGLFILFVASISIVVAMTMSTYQRRRQIGIMKVLGANLRQIRNMFIVESTMLGLLGGAVGVLLSYWVIWTINIFIVHMNGSSSGSGSSEVLFISLWILPVGLVFAALTGILSGIYPAIKAARTDALTAIKRE